MEDIRQQGGISREELDRRLEGRRWARNALGLSALVAAAAGGYALGGYTGITARTLQLLDAAAATILRVVL